MGLIRTAIDSVKGTLQDQHQIVINCEDMGNEILMIKKTRQSGIIRNGSRIVVNPGQLAVLVDNGRVIDATAEQGVFEFRTDSAPSFFAGNFGAVFKEMWTRFVFGGATWQDQAVYFVNVKEIMDNGFGTPAPVMYRDWEHMNVDVRRGTDMPLLVNIRCMGNYTFQIDQPALFMQKIGGTTPIYQKDELCNQMRMEIIAVFQAVLNSLCDETHKIFPTMLPAQGFLIKELMDQKVFDQHIRQRGIRIGSFNILSAILDEESKQKIDRFERVSDEATQRAREVDARILAASNEAGAGVGFFNLNMANNAMGGSGYQPPQMQQPVPQPAPQVPVQSPPAPVAAPGGGACANCGAALTGPFCAQCGTPAPKPAERFCAQCGAKASGPFCAQCGTKLG